MTITTSLSTFLSPDAASAHLLPCHDAEAADLFFSERPADLEQAKMLCADCPLIEDCRRGALEREEPWGVWGGSIFESGRIIAVKRGRGRPRKDRSAVSAA
ncbi:WhiB family transcriptional regulator [Brachybacterium sp. J144]|uniref:WhiB family transcriptional regulator n=1 Tax=unclassified Brachybacterium TaxID=2623841 RepID=UPI002E7958E3|nr:MULTISPECIES: WhiB family transcriptional regulator [unclassified Brachybacterium]MEE1619258.1 WhiB family transcriptional regulator [Brachybacterium sp. J153]MEE1649298.1 WhiB family transcriptional regulator [Brachybacterium sp. J144]